MQQSGCSSLLKSFCSVRCMVMPTSSCSRVHHHDVPCSTGINIMHDHCHCVILGNFNLSFYSLLAIDVITYGTYMVPSHCIGDMPVPQPKYHSGGCPTIARECVLHKIVFCVGNDILGLLLRTAAPLGTTTVLQHDESILTRCNLHCRCAVMKHSAHI